MPELRQNIATKEWVIIAPERARRPNEYARRAGPPPEPQPTWDPSCPFCPGREEELTLIRHEVPGPDGTWQVRIVANRYPALSAEAPAGRLTSGFFRSSGGFGVHDVVIESPVHNLTTALLPDEEIALLLGAFRDRGRQLATDDRLRQAVFFKNHGPFAGTSVGHPHCQLAALPVVPAHVRARLEEAMRYHDEHGSCVFCDMWRQELTAGARVLVENEGCVAFVPFAALSPFHIWIIPKTHRPLFTSATDQELGELASVLRLVLLKIHHGLADPSYNFVIRMAPFPYERVPWFHWYVSIVPRVSRVAGFELGSGMYINPSLPEDSARFLRDLEV